MIIWQFATKIKERVASQPLEFLISYFAFAFIYFSFYIYIDQIDSCVPILQLYIIGVYPVVDFSLSLLSWFMLRNMIKRKVFLIKENCEEIRKKI